MTNQSVDVFLYFLSVATTVEWDLLSSQFVMVNTVPSELDMMQVTTTTRGSPFSPDGE